MAVDPWFDGNRFRLDTWASLDYKGRRLPVHGGQFLMPGWVSDQRRRLHAYILLTSYLENVSRHFLLDDELQEDRKELGDPSLIVDTIVSALLGDDVEIRCKESAELEKWAQGWGKKVRAVRRLFSAEGHAVALGDGVLALDWDGVKKRPTLKVYNPGFYFPVIDTGEDDEFPDRIHIAWEFDRKNDQGSWVRWVRRITWELEDINGEGSTDLEEEEDAVDVRCYKTDGEWLLEDLDGAIIDYDHFPLDRGTFYTNSLGEEMRHYDTGLDFIPVIHIPNTSSDDDEHFGQSSLSKILQILDEVQATDSDLAKGAAIAGFPPMAADGAISGADGNDVLTYGPGTVFSGKITSIDTSKSLDALLNYLEKLLHRAAVNVRLPETALGRIKIQGNIAAITLAMTFAPMRAMIGKMRLIREEKHPLIFEFAYKIAKVNGMPGLPAVPEDFDDWPSFLLGDFLPVDNETIVSNVVALLGATPSAISIETAVQMLIDAGIPIEDAAAEVKKIQHVDFRGAQLLQAALGDDKAVATYLDVPIPDPPPPPPPPPSQSGVPAPTGPIPRNPPPPAPGST